MALIDDVPLIGLKVRAETLAHGELLGAFPQKDTLRFTLTLPARMAADAPAVILTEGDYEEDGLGGRKDKNRVFRFPFVRQKKPAKEQKSESGGRDSFILTLPLRDFYGLYFYTLQFDCCYGHMALSYDPLHYRPKITWADEPHEPFHLTVYDDDYTTPAFFKGGILYQIFVDRFAKGQKESAKTHQKPGTILEADWENGIPQYAPYRGAPLKNNLFFGGDLYGVAEKLDYLCDLGVNCLYLCPVFDAASNHKYDTGDYDKVDAMFGGDEALEALIEKAREKGIAILLDGVFNHTGDDSRYFNKYGHYAGQGAYQSQNSPYYDWYHFTKWPDRYKAWWGIDILPTVNTQSPAFTDYICGENGVVRRWLRKGIAGWRLDVADEVAESFLVALRGAARAEKSDALLLGEVWEDASEKIAYGKRRSYFHGKELDAVMNYPVGNALSDYLLTNDASALFDAAKRLYSHYPKGSSDCLMNLLGTHDTVRILTKLSGIGENDRSDAELAMARLSPEERTLGKKRLKIAWFLLSLLPGVPCIYYGDEAGMEGYHDPFNRRPFPWHAIDEELLAFYRQINRLRRGEPLLAEGWLRLREDLPAGVFALERFDDDEKEALFAAVNLSDAPYRVPFEGVCLYSTDAACPPGKRLRRPLLAPGGVLLVKKTKPNRAKKASFGQKT